MGRSVKQLSYSMSQALQHHGKLGTNQLGLVDEPFYLSTQANAAVICFTTASGANSLAESALQRSGMSWSDLISFTKSLTKRSMVWTD